MIQVAHDPDYILINIEKFVSPNRMIIVEISVVYKLYVYTL